MKNKISTWFVKHYLNKYRYFMLQKVNGNGIYLK